MAIGDTGGKLRRTLGELVDCAIERRTIGGIHGFQQLPGKIECDRSELRIDVPSGRGQ